MKVGYAVLYEDGELVISKDHTLLQKRIIKDYGEFEDTNVSWKKESIKIKKVQILNQVKSNCMKEWFYGCMNLTTLINFQNLDVSDCPDFSHMFFDCESLQNIDALQNWNVRNCIYFFKMFEYCVSLKKISLPKNMKYLNRYMFFNCNEDLKIHWKKHIYTYEDLFEYREIS